jgi:hypothetical protein
MVLGFKAADAIGDPIGEDTLQTCGPNFLMSYF